MAGDTRDRRLPRYTRDADRPLLLLCDAIIATVRAHHGIEPDQPVARSTELYANIAARITGWASGQLCIAPADYMSRAAAAAIDTARTLDRCESTATTRTAQQ